MSGTTCGYCERPLVLRLNGTWECPRCAPLLADVRDVAAFATFQRKAWRTRPNARTKQAT